MIYNDKSVEQRIELDSPGYPIGIRAAYLSRRFVLEDEDFICADKNRINYWD